MPISLNLDSAIYKWQSVHNKRMTYSELARQAGISLATLNRIKSGEVLYPDLRKINSLCKVLECAPGDLLQRVDTKSLESAELELQERGNLLKAIERASAPDDLTHDGRVK